MITFSCSCGMKFNIKPEYAGRSCRCPTCKQPLVVPIPDKTVAYVPVGQIDGTKSSPAQAGVEGGVTVGQVADAASPGQNSVDELLARRSNNSERYIIEQEIARGGMGAVLRAVDCDIRREVAIKYMLVETDPTKKLRFIEEGQITGQLEHPNIVPIHELGVDKENRVFFSMKMVKGHSLAQVLDELRQNPKTSENKYPLVGLLNIVVNVCNGLAYAHSRGVVHRDLKPSNIMLGDFGEVYVMDWGLAKVLHGDRHSPLKVAPSLAVPVPSDKKGSAPVAVSITSTGSASSSQANKLVTSREAEADLTQEGAILGTPVYMPPEQATGDIQAIDQRSDIYSLGALLYEVLALLPPIEKEGGYLAILMRVVEGKIVPPEKRNPQRARVGKIPRELSAIAMKALAKNPQDRYQNIESLRLDIERFQEGRSVSAKEDTKREMLVKFVKRNKGFSAASAVGLMLLLGCLVVIARAWWETGQAHAAYKMEQEDKQKRTREAVPAFIRAGRLAVNERQFKDALDQATVAVDYDPDNAEAHLFKAQVLIVQQQYPEARVELEKCLKLRSGDVPAENLLKLCPQARSRDVATCLAFAELFTEQKAYGLADGMMQEFGENAQEARNKLLELYRKRIESAWPGLGGRLQLSVKGKYDLNLQDCEQVTDLSALVGVPLTSLNLSGCVQVRDLTPLKDMWLTYLDLGRCGSMRDLTPLKDMRLTYLSLFECYQVHDLTPLKDMPLTTLFLHRSAVTDLTPLKDMKLSGFTVTPKNITKGMDVLRQMKSITAIGIDWNRPIPFETFWKKYDAGEFK